MQKDEWIKFILSVPVDDSIVNFVSISTNRKLKSESTGFIGIIKTNFLVVYLVCNNVTKILL